MTRILATGDLHLGAGAELGRQPGDRLRDQADVLEQIAHVANERDVDAVLIAGDIFEGPGIPPEQLEVFADFVDHLCSVGVPVVACLGNGRHDAAARATNGLAIFRHIPGIRVSSTPELIEVAGCTIATLPWVHPGRYIAAHGRDSDRDETNSVVADLLLEAARGLRAQIDEGRTAILLAHWSVSGSALPNGLPVDQLREPVLDAYDFEKLGFDAIVAGHIHKPQLFGEALNPCVPDNGKPLYNVPFLYVGSPLPLNFGETNTEHGAWILETGVKTPLDVDATSLEFVPVESRPLVTIDVDIADEPDEFEPVFGLDDRDLSDAIVRVRYRATTEQHRRLDSQRLRAAIIDRGAHVVKIQPDIVRADRARVEGVDESLTTLDALGHWIEANAIDPELAEQMRDHTTRYLEAVT